MSAGFLLERFDEYKTRTALVWRDRRYTYEQLRNETVRWIDTLGSRDDIRPGAVVALCADYSPQSLALLLALLDRRCVVSLLTGAFEAQKDELLGIAEVRTEILVDEDDTVRFANVGHDTRHPLLTQLQAEGASGLVLFSSGSTGKSKAVVHDGARLMNKFRTPRRAKVTIPFMLFDHIGGVNTVLHVLSSGGTAVIAPDRTPETICRLVQEHRVQVLPTSPTFVNLLLLVGLETYDLGSLEILSYGAERMPAATLSRLGTALPNVQLIQNYGLSEVGIMRTKSESSDSLWMKVGGDGFETRVRDGLLEIKAETAMLGYLNEVSPFTDDGWLRTKDRVDVKGEYIRILGRASQVIIIGGEKVYPAEVEDLIESMDGVVEVVVGAEANAIMGNIVKATVRLSTDERRSAFRERMTAFLSDKLVPFKIPQKVTVSKEALHNARFKKTRGGE